MSTVDELADDLARLPAQPVAAVRVLRLVEDPRTSARDLAKLIEADPSLSARVMRLANSPYYGLARKVGSASQAVVLLGFSTVRALAVTATCGLLAERGKLGPGGYWGHSVSTAVAANRIAQEVGTSTGDAFSAGLLHDLGVALLFRRDASPYEVGDQDLLEAEVARFGMTHARAGAAALDSWRFPKAFVNGVAAHHDDVPGSSTLARVLRGAEAIAVRLEAVMDHAEPTVDFEAAFDDLRVRPNRAKSLVSETRDEIAAVASFLDLDG